MSQSPEEELDEARGYRTGWSAVARLLRRGWSWSGHERHCAFWNPGQVPVAEGSPSWKPFSAVGAVAGIDLPEDGRAVARVDWDGDGDQDLFVTARSAPRLRFLRNERAPDAASSLEVRLLGGNGNSGAIGARVEVELNLDGAPVLVRTRRAGEGFLSQSSEWLHFGLGKAVAERVHVEWPGGERETFAGPFEGGRWVLMQGSGEARPWRARERVRTDVSEADAWVQTDASERARLVLTRELPVPELKIELEDGRPASLFGVGEERSQTAGRNIALHLWASWCAPCRGELKSWAGAKEQLLEAGISIIALSLDDDEEERASAVQLLDDIAWPFSRAFATPAAIQILEVMQGALRDNEERLPVPTTWLFNDRGFLVAVYFGPLEPAVLCADSLLLNLDEESRFEAATPFAGQWSTKPEGISASLLESAFRRQALPGVAKEMQRASIDVVDFEQLGFLLRVAEARAQQGRLEEALTTYRQATEIDRRSFDAQRGLGFVAQSLENYGEARDAYREALSLRPKDPETRFELGRVALELGELALAQRQLQALEKSSSPLAEPLRELIEEQD